MTGSTFSRAFEFDLYIPFTCTCWNLFPQILSQPVSFSRITTACSCLGIHCVRLIFSLDAIVSNGMIPPMWHSRFFFTNRLISTSRSSIYYSSVNTISLKMMRTVLCVCLHNQSIWQWQGGDPYIWPAIVEQPFPGPTIWVHQNVRMYELVSVSLVFVRTSCY